MSQNKPPVDLVAGVWTDLSVSTGIAAGTKVIIQVTQSREVVYFADTAVKPTDTSPFNTCSVGDYIVNDTGDAGLWAYSRSGARLIVREA
jgi:ethanolamine utilization microcompartment shell protein EutL